MAQPTMKVRCTNPDNRFYGEVGTGQIRLINLRTGVNDLGFCVQLDNTNDWHEESRQDWSNTDGKRSQTQNQRRPARRTNDNMENERKPTQKISSSSRVSRSKPK